MSSSIEERIVSMVFDNRKFQSGVNDSISSINKLKSGLNFEGATKGLDAIDASTKKLNFDGLARGVEAVKVKFSALQVVAVTALSNIANSAIEVGKNLISSLTIDPIMDGYADYGRKLTSIQTIMNATGKSIKDVEPYFNQLDEYADKTIYNLDDMTSAMAKFTNAGVDLDKSVPAIKGIANMVAVAGQDAGAAQIAFYNLSQSIAGGFLTTTDYKSLNLANVATKEWKDNMIKGAIAAGTLKDAGNGMYQIKGAKEAVTGAALFNEELSKGWATTNVLLDVLGQYGDTNTEIGAKAQAAAQDIKSFSMMMDTLKASVGTTWTDTFEILIGNLEESKALFTPLTNTISGFVSASADARNSLLQGWKDLGGRTMLIDAIKSAFDNVMTVVKALSGAFRDIFPATTSQDLMNFTTGLKTLIDNLKLSDTNAANLRSTFEGIFAVIDIGKTIFLAVADAVGIMMTGVGNLGSTILATTGSFGEWLTALDKTLKESGVISKILSTLAYTIRNGLNSISTVLGVVGTTIKNIITTVGSKINFPGFENLKSFLTILGDTIFGVGVSADSMCTNISKSMKSMADAIINSKIGELFKAILDGIKIAVDGIISLIGKLVDALTNSLKNVNFDGIIAAFGAMSLGGMFLAFKKFLKGLTDPLDEAKGFFEKIGDAFDGVKDTLDGVRGSLETYQQNLKADMLLKIGAAIALLAGSIVLISSIDSDKLGSSLAAMGALFAELLLAMKAYTTIGDMKLKVATSSGVMIVMATSILILSVAMKNLSTLDWEGVMKGAAGIALLAKILVSTAKGLSEGSGYMITGAAGMIGFALAIKILAGVCKDLGDLNWEQLKMGLMGVGGLVAEITLFLNNATFGPKAISNAAGILILSGAIKVLASAVKDFSSMSWDSIVVGLKSIGILLGELALFSQFSGSSKGMISTGLSMIAIAGAMKILASAVKDFSSMSWDSIATGLTAMGIALAEIAVAMNFMPKDTLIISVGLMGIGVALDIIANALLKLSSTSWDSLKTGLTAMGASLAILALALKAMNGTLAGSAALLIASAALMLLAPALIMLGSMSWDAIIKGLTALAGVFVILGVAGVLLTPLVPTILALSEAIVLLGVGVMAIGTGFLLVGAGLTAAATGLTLLATSVSVGAAGIVAALGVIITGVAALIPAVMVKIVEGIVAFCKTLADGIPSILTSVTTIITAIVNCIVQNVPTIVNGVLQTLSAILAALVQWIPTIGQQVADIIVALLKILADNITKFTIAAVDIIVGFIKGITDSLPKIIDSALKLVVTFINGLADAIRNNSNAINDVCYNLVTAIVDGIGSFYNKMVDAGIYVVKGFVKGIGDSVKEVINAGKELGRRALEAAEEALDINSPSREFRQLGLYSGEGYVNGLVYMGKKVSDAAYNMGAGALNTMSNAISGVSDLFSNSVDSQPVIRPVIDLSEAQNGANRLYNMMDSVSGYGIDSSVSVVSSSAKNAVNRQILSNDTDTNILNQKSTNGASDTITKQPITLQLMLQNGKAIAEYIIDDVDSLMGSKTKITGRMVGI